MRVAVIGAGLGGLAVAVRLAGAGHDVVVFERNAQVGGKLATLEHDGYRFDLGPSVLTDPAAYDELFRTVGTSLADQVELVALDPQWRCRWTDGSTLDVHDDERAWRDALDRFSPGASGAWQRYTADAERAWSALTESYLAETASRGNAIVQRLRSGDRSALDAKRTLAECAADHFDDPRLRQLVGSVASVVGGSPFRVPATFAALTHLERTYGAWHVRGGYGALRDAIARVAVDAGVDVRCDTDVGRITVRSRRATGVELADGGHVDADAVVAGVDTAHLVTELVPDPKAARELDRAGRSTSGFLVCAGVRGRTDGLAHRSILFSLHERTESERIERGLTALDPTVLAVVSSVSDRSMAPRDAENWYLLVQTPAAIGVDRKMMTASVLNRLAERGIDLRQRIDFTRTMVPADFEARYRAIGGAYHGPSLADGAALRRASNAGNVEGLYLVGGSVHPGGGTTFVLHGARIAADLVTERGG
jgi:phytoene desaturase